ncbi:MAG TPA: chemotaxis protein CheB, partial [Roseiflexaceae bacterium]|nr:chemotaxis protein CheB [Roseiflexaceae bacterium]
MNESQRLGNAANEQEEQSAEEQAALASDGAPEIAPSIDGNGREDPVVVGIGASAGGLDAFKQFFAATPADSKLAFVLIQHLDPNHESLMADLLARYTSMPVVQVEDNMPVHAGHVYIIPPNTYMTISHNTLYLTEPTERRGMRMAIDFFFRSLAEDRREKAICIILSGTGSDGSLGLKAVKERGGMVMVQEPATAQYDGMPRSAIATGLTDYNLPIEQMPDALIKYVRHSYVNGGATTRRQPPDAPDFLNSVLARIRSQTNHDFRAYKKTTLMRRIERRMSLHQIEQNVDYLRFLQQNDEEVIQLFKDLLISVTNFFRDYEAFNALDALAIDVLVQRHPPEVPLRVWVPGCATGEEAYSLAIMFAEHLASARKNCPLQVFATDIDEHALEIARAGIYPESIAADLTPERLRRFFTHDDHHYRVTKQLRDTVVFATQNLTSDPPFSKIDLISCRNLLIYLDPAVQKRVMALFHFALNENGVLFLGNAETIGTQESLFAPLSKKWRIYRRLSGTQRLVPNFSTVSAEEERRVQPHSDANLVSRRSLGTRVQQILLDTFAPTAVLINSRYECLYIHNPQRNDQPYLHVPSGEPSQSLFEMLREELRAPVRTAVLRAFRESQTVTISTSLKRQRGPEEVAITAEPFSLLGAEDLLMLHFAGQHGEPEIESEIVELPSDEVALRQL